jgi:hypothetical protein
MNGIHLLLELEKIPSEVSDLSSLLMVAAKISDKLVLAVRHFIEGIQSLFEGSHGGQVAHRDKRVRMVARDRASSGRRGGRDIARQVDDRRGRGRGRRRSHHEESENEF